MSAAPAMPIKENKPLQDYHAWQGYGTAKLWADIIANPCLAPELIAQHMSKLGLVSPSEPTSAALAAAILVALYGPAAASVISNSEIQKHYDWIKALRYANMHTFCGDYRLYMHIARGEYRQYMWYVLFFVFVFSLFVLFIQICFYY